MVTATLVTSSKCPRETVTCPLSKIFHILIVLSFEPEITYFFLLSIVLLSFLNMILEFYLLNRLIDDPPLLVYDRTNNLCSKILEKSHEYNKRLLSLYIQGK